MGTENALSPVDSSASVSDDRMASMQGLWESEWSRLDQRHSAEIQRYQREIEGIKEEQQRVKPTQQSDMALTVVEAELAAFTTAATAGLEWLVRVKSG